MTFDVSPEQFPAALDEQELLADLGCFEHHDGAPNDDDDDCLDDLYDDREFGLALAPIARAPIARATVARAQIARARLASSRGRSRLSRARLAR